MPATATHSPTTYDVSLFRDGFAVVEVYANGFGRNVVADGFECEAAADAHIEDLLAAERDEAAALAQFDADNAEIDAAAEAQRLAVEAAYHDELNKLYALVNAQGGYVEPEDKAGQARVRAINDVLAFIEKVA